MRLGQAQINLACRSAFAWRIFILTSAIRASTIALGSSKIHYLCKKFMCIMRPFSSVRTTILLIAAGLFLAACASVRRTASPASAESPESQAGLPAVLLPPPAGYTDAERAGWYYLEGIRLAGITGDPVRAGTAFQMALGYDSLHAPSLFELAGLSIESDPERSLAFSRKAGALEPDNLWYQQQLGRLYIETERYDSAATVYGRIVRLAPNDPENYRYLAALYEQTGRTDEAIALLDSAETRLGPVEGLAYYKRQLLAGAGRIDRAIEETLSLTRNLPYDERYFILLGELYSRNRDDSLALDAYGRALTLDPSNVEALIGINELYRTRNDALNFLASTKRLFRHEAIPLDTKLAFFDDAIKNPVFYREYYGAVDDLVETLAAAYPDSEEVLDLRIGHRINSGDIEGALLTGKEALSERSPLEAWLRITDIESYLSRPDSTVYYADRALARFPESIDLYLRKGYALTHLSRYREAVATMRQALEHAPSDSVKSAIYSSMGDVLHQQDPDKLRKVFACYERALALDPDNVHALNNYSYFLSEEDKDLDRALTMSARVAELEPGNPTYIDTYGWVLFKLGRLEEAKTALRQAVSLDSGESSVLMIHYGDVLYELKEYYMASVYWRKALEKGHDAGEIEARLKMIEGK
jgi:tetratricopeptide (TPR) repeat protein